MNSPLIIAHRGTSARAPENTLAAFRQAIADGADGVEFDVRLAKCGTVVVIHDSTLRRVGQRPEAVSSMTAAELGDVDVGSWFSILRKSPDPDEFKAETVPTLASVLNLLRDFSGRIYIELKCRESDAEKLATAVCDVIRDSPQLSQMIVKSFRLEVIPHVRRLCPEVKTAALFAPKIMTILRKEKRLVNIAVDLGAHMLSVHYSLATKKLMKKAAARNLPVTIWTADHPRWFRRGAKLGLFAIITNDPLPLLARRLETGQAKNK